jgi:predicted GNAT family N-acyltransferase
MTEVRPARDAAELRDAVALRREVFVAEQGVTPADEDDGRDDEALHLVAVEGARVVGTCRLLREGATVKLSRLAVARGARGHGVASRLLEEAERRAGELGGARIALAAQTHAVGLYERAGYTPRGRPFVDAGIEHLTMDKDLAGA